MAAIFDTHETQNTSDNYNQMLDNFIKKRLNLVQNDAHPCLQKKLCKKGSQCPFIGLPNDTCLFHLTDECNYGKKCRYTHYDEYAKIYKDAKHEFKKMLEEMRLNAKKAIELDKEWLDQNTRVCPKCTVPVEKINGCPSMSCPVCQIQFNWDQMKYAKGAANLHKFDRALNEAENLRLRPLSEQKINVIVIASAGKGYSINLALSDAQVEDIMKEMEERTKIPVNRQRMISCGKELCKEKSIAEYAIKNGSIIFLVQRLPGGSN
ncbi:hypothetical protein I4U23_020082 [Adineta vaga]|nr:hypothetical protein I4U23_020082 [Adineta vaga]